MPALSSSFVFFFQCYAAHRDLHSFPTRRSSDLSLEACSAVERAAAELGYVPNRAARSIASGRSESVGVVIPEPRSSLFLDPLFPRLLRGIGEELSASGLQMVLFAPQSPSDVQRLEQYLAGGHRHA